MTMCGIAGILSFDNSITPKSHLPTLQSTNASLKNLMWICPLLILMLLGSVALMKI